MTKTNHASRVRFELALVHWLAIVIGLALPLALAGCRLDRGANSLAPPHLVRGNGPYTARHATCREPSSGFHPTVWQPWQEGSMAMRCGNGEAWIAHFPQGANGAGNPAGPVGQGASPEVIPVPDAEKAGEALRPATGASLGTEALQRSGSGNPSAQGPSKVQDSVPGTKEMIPPLEKPTEKPTEPPTEKPAAKPLEKPAEKPPLSLPPALGAPPEPITKTSVPRASHAVVADPLPKALARNLPVQSKTSLGSFFAHSPLQQTSFSDADTPITKSTQDPGEPFQEERPPTIHRSLINTLLRSRLANHAVQVSPQEDTAVSEHKKHGKPTEPPGEISDKEPASLSPASGRLAQPIPAPPAEAGSKGRVAQDKPSSATEHLTEQSGRLPGALVASFSVEVEQASPSNGDESHIENDQEFGEAVTEKQ